VEPPAQRQPGALSGDRGRGLEADQLQLPVLPGGPQAIPKAVIEAAAIDGAGPGRRFWRIVFPLLSPTTFFLLVVNLVYAFFDTFGIIHAVTGGGPAKATETLVYKVFNDGFIGLDFGAPPRSPSSSWPSSSGSPSSSSATSSGRVVY
jgi:hypothetical protein